MIMMSEDLASYISALSLPSSVTRPYVNMVDKWCKNSGIEWTVKRCKSLYTDLIRYNAGLPLVGQWYKKNKDGLPSGILSYLFRLSTRKGMKFKVMTLMRIYTRFTSPNDTPTQVEKFLKGVTASDIGSSPISQAITRAGVSYGLKSSAVPVQPSYISFTPSPGRRAPTYWGTTVPEEECWNTQWETLEETKLGRNLETRYPSIFRKVFKGFLRMRIGIKHFGPTAVDSVGKIGLIQEPGYKLRAVANPNRVYQIALKPLGDVIYDTLRTLPWDCTFEQSKGFNHIQKHLSEEKKAFCVDLTGATDYFPLSLQIDLLSELFPNHVDYINLFKDLSRAPWFFKDTTIQWTKGQPLGLYPSFGSFALCHGLLLLALNDGKHENEFFVLGDDVVILNPGLYTKYIEALKCLDCPISAEKSIISSDIAEFGGKIITRDEILPQLKWKNVSDDNFIDIMKLLGMKAKRLLRPRQRKVANALADIPDFVGGLGFNPKGIPLKDRYEKYLTLFGEDTGTFQMSLDRKFNNFFTKEGESPNSSRSFPIWNDQKLPDLDQKSAGLCLRYLPLFVEMYGIMGTNLYSVAPEKDILPIDGFAGKRITLLELLERKLF